MKKIFLYSILATIMTAPSAQASEEMLWQMGSDFLRGGVDRVMDGADQKLRDKVYNQDDDSGNSQGSIEPSAGSSGNDTPAQSPRAAAPSPAPDEDSYPVRRRGP